MLLCTQCFVLTTQVLLADTLKLEKNICYSFVNVVTNKN